MWSEGYKETVIIQKTSDKWTSRTGSWAALDRIGQARQVSPYLAMEVTTTLATSTSVPVEGWEWGRMTAMTWLGIMK